MDSLNNEGKIGVSTVYLEKLKNKLGNLILERMGWANEKNRIEQKATIFELKEKEPSKKRILVIGLNGHFNEGERDKEQPADKNYSYFTSFKEEILKEYKEDDICFFDLVPVRTGNKKCLKYREFEDELADKLKVYLETALKLIDPDLVLANDINVSKFFIKYIFHGDTEKSNTVAYYHLNNRKVPIVFSGHITGVRKIDEYNRQRLVREIKETLIYSER